MRKRVLLEAWALVSSFTSSSLLFIMIAFGPFVVGEPNLAIRYSELGMLMLSFAGLFSLLRVIKLD